MSSDESLSADHTAGFRVQSPRSPAGGLDFKGEGCASVGGEVSPMDGGVEMVEVDAALEGAAAGEVIVGAGERKRKKRGEEKREKQEVGHSAEDWDEEGEAGDVL